MINNKKTIFKSRLDTGCTHEVSEDFFLPDYMPEVRQIVSCSASVLPESRYIDQNDITLSGIVTYTVLYVGDDGRLSAAPLNSEYSVRLSTQGSDMTGLSQDAIVAVTALTSSTCRATGPRRLVLTSRMYSKIYSGIGEEYAQCIRATSADGDTCIRPADELSLERHFSSVESSNIYNVRSTGHLSGDFKEREGTRVIACGASAGVTEVRCDGRDVTVRGDAYVHCLVADADGIYSSLRLKSPFEERLTVGGAISHGDDKKSASATVRCASISINGGDGGAFSWELEYDVDVISTGDVTTDVTDDIYSTEYETTVEEAPLPSVICLKNANSALSLSGTRQLSEGDTKRICYTTEKLTVERTECTSDGKIIINGGCNVQVLLSEDGRITSEEITLPLKFECPCRVCDGKRHVMCDACVIRTDAHLDGDKLIVDTEVCVSVFAYGECTSNHISACTIDRDRPTVQKESLVKIYFPDDGEDIWSIGKKYHCRTDSITPVCDNGPVIIMK